MNYYGSDGFGNNDRGSSVCFCGRPRGRKLDSSPSTPAASCIHSVSPYGLRRRMHSRSAATSASVYAALTCCSQDEGRGTGPASSGGKPNRAGAALDHGQSWA
jgi:hypothetical protein